MDISPAAPWNDHILAEFKKVIGLGFDGIHLDQYGFPKKALDKREKLVDLSLCFSPFINRAKRELNKIKSDVGLIFNNVTNFGSDATARAAQEAIYIEVWSPINDYRDLKTLIDQTKMKAGDKQIILAAYLPSFGSTSQYSQEETEAGALITMAAIFANGAYHLLIGEDAKVLTEGYYPNYGRMSPGFIRKTRAYYDFIVRYRELLFVSNLRDLSFTHTGGYNSEIGRDNEFEFEKEGLAFAPHGQMGTVWTLIKENADYVVLNLINLVDLKSDVWNAGQKANRVPINGIKVRRLILEGVSRVYYASPDYRNGELVDLPVGKRKSTNGYMMEVKIPWLANWGMVYFVKRKK